MILLDTSGLLSALFPDQHHHDECAACLSGDPGPFIVSPFVLAELDYMVGRHAGSSAQLLLLEEVATGAYELAPFTSIDVARARDVMDRFADLEIGLADASIVVLSERLATTNLLSLDQRHFRALRGHREQPFRLLPLDV